MKLVNTLYVKHDGAFESFVNSERCKTKMEHLYHGLRLMGKILLEQVECHS